MKKNLSNLVALLLVVCLTMLLFGGCAPKDSVDGDTELPVLRVAVMPFYISSPIGYMVDNGLDVANGFKVEQIMFPSGAPMNEAVASDSYDIATNGGAFIFGVANFNTKVIASHISGTGGNEIWIEKGSAIAAKTGVNPAFPTVVGDPEALKGAVIAQATGTTSQLAIIKWLEALGKH